MDNYRYKKECHFERADNLIMSLRGGTTKQSHRVQYASEEIATLRSNDMIGQRCRNKFGM